jgi:hypothetical protein
VEGGRWKGEGGRGVDNECNEVGVGWALIGRRVGGDREEEKGWKVEGGSWKGRWVSLVLLSVYMNQW